MTTDNTLMIDGREVAIEGERNLLELCRKAGIDIPTFCYHSELSVYGACRLCLVDIEGRGIVTSCSTTPEPGMKLRTNTEEIRDMRRITIELLLADHDQSCATCAKSPACQLQRLARRLGVDRVRFQKTRQPAPIDDSSPSLVRDPNKCVLCGDCVRVCHEIQGIGAIDFAHRGAQSAVLPAFGKDLAKVECVYCGQCARVCPTGAITIRSEIDDVWAAINDPTKKVVAQIAPAVRVALGEAFGMEPGAIATGQMVAALRSLGFDKVFDTCFTADLTVIEEANEFLKRVEKGENLPQFTSCCPAWITYAEQYYPDLLPNLSSCRSPQQMFGSLAKDVLPEVMGVEAKDIVVVSIMPCTAKKHESDQDKFVKDGLQDVDYVLTTQELARMIDEAGLNFAKLQPESLDLPLGFKTGAGVIFGATGGVSEAVLRYVTEKVGGKKLDAFEFHAVRGQEGIREASVKLGDKEVRIAIVFGLANARKLAERIRKGDCPYQFIEVMSCPGGCVGGAGQPVTNDVMKASAARAKGLYDTDKTLQLHKPQDNYYVSECYSKNLGEIGGHKAHELLHTRYNKRRRIEEETISLVTGKSVERLVVGVCVGTSCHVRGSNILLRKLIQHVQETGAQPYVDINASFCYERCDRGPTVSIGARVIERCTFELARDIIDAEVTRLRTTQTV